MPRYKLTIAYEGTDFCGWQKQEPFAPPPPAAKPADQVALAPMFAVHRGTDAFEASEELPVRPDETKARIALRTVQHVVEQAVRKVVRERIELIGASRTDSGVHAKGQVAAFTCSGDEAAGTGAGWPESRGTDRLLRAVNGSLPRDVQIVAAELTEPCFNPIRDCTSKAYSYTLHVCRPPPNGDSLRALWDRRLVHQVWDQLNVDAMNAAAQVLVGEHDFVSFAAANHGRLTTVRTVLSCGVSDLGEKERGGRVRIDITGTGFLYNMVRIIGGTLVEVGRGRMTLERVRAALESLDRRNAGPTLPPTGLCLEWIRYDQPPPAPTDPRSTSPL